MLFPVANTHEYKIIICRNAEEQKRVRAMFPDFHTALPDEDHCGYRFTHIVFTHPHCAAVDWAARLRPNGQLVVLGLPPDAT